MMYVQYVVFKMSTEHFFLCFALFYLFICKKIYESKSIRGLNLIYPVFIWKKYFNFGKNIFV